MDRAALDVKAGRLADPGEEARFRRCHPYLPAPFEPGEKGRAASGIEVGGHLVQEQDRRLAATFGHQLRMGRSKAGRAQRSAR